MDKQTLDAYRQRRWDAYAAWYAADDPVPVKMWLWDAYVDAKRMHELAQAAYDAASREAAPEGTSDGHRNR